MRSWVACVIMIVYAAMSPCEVNVVKLESNRGQRG